MGGDEVRRGARHRLVELELEQLGRYMGDMGEMQGRYRLVELEAEQLGARDEVGVDELGDLVARRLEDLG